MLNAFISRPLDVIV